MNKWTKLQKILNLTFGFDHIKKSSVKKLKQFFDEKSDEHVFIIEYRCMIDRNPKKTEHEKSEVRRINKLKLLRDINDRSLLWIQPGVRFQRHRLPQYILSPINTTRATPGYRFRTDGDPDGHIPIILVSGFCVRQWNILSNSARLYGTQLRGK